MFRSVQIIGYRGFTRYGMRDLGRVNLLVGRNNSGKTSVLEALYLLGRQGDPKAFTRVCSQRGESLPRDEARSVLRAELDVAHLFNGHELSKGLEFSVGAENAGAKQTLTVLVLEVANIDAEDLPEVGSAEDLLAIPSHFEMQVLSSPVGRKRIFALTPRGGFVTDSGAIPIRSSVFNPPKLADNVHFVSTEAMGGGELSRLWDRIQLTAHEGLVLQALRFVDPGIEQIRATEIGAGPGTRGTTS